MKSVPILTDLYFGIKLIGNPDDDDDDDDYDEECEEEDEDDYEECIHCTDESEDDTPSIGDLFELDDDDDIVTDEDLEEQLNIAEECNSENMRNLASPDGVVCWSKVMYGDDGRTSHQESITHAPEIVVGCLGHGEVVVEVNPAPSKARPISVPKPTVTSRFFRALQTRTFRRWLV